MEEKLAREKEDKERQREEARKAPRPNPFGGAKPVDTLKKEREMEEKLTKLSVKTEEREKPPIENAWRVRKPDEGQKSPGGAYRPPGADRRDDKRDDRGYDRDKRDDRGYDRYKRDDRDRRDDRGNDRGGYDKDRRGYDDRRGGSERVERRDDDRRGGSDRDDRKDDRYDRKDDRDDRKDVDRVERREEAKREETDVRNGEEKEKSVEKAEKEMKKIEEPKPVAVATNKFAFLQEEDGSGSGNED